ncbi:MAG: hypothetical protein R2700_02600 [Solirubrobacterales bacterium]
MRARPAIRMRGMRGMRVIAALTAVVGLCAVHVSTASAGPPPLQTLDVVRQVEPQLPEGVTVFQEQADGGNGGYELAPDEKHGLFLVNVDGVPQIAITKLNGGGYQCLTCGLSARATKPEAFSDERRIWFSDNAGGGIGDQQWAILECSPSIYDCQSARKLEVDFPIDSVLASPVGAQNREAKPDDLGQYVAWNEVRTTDGTRVTVARLERTTDGYRLVDPRTVNPAFSTDSSDQQDWVDGGRFYEGGEWVGGNRYLKYQTTRTALNYDTVLLDLKTGKRRFVTKDFDYNELARYSPDASWTLYSSARGLDRMDVFTDLKRPSFIDDVAFGQVGRISLWNNRRCMNEMWLMNADIGQRRGGYAGQPFVIHPDWNIRRADWFDSGRKVLITETRLPNRTSPTEVDQRVRTYIVRIPGLPKEKVPKPIPVSKLPLDSYSTPSDEYLGMAARDVTGKVVNGPGGGTATFTSTGNFTAGKWSVTYDGYSEDGKSFIDGTESLETPLASVSGTWSADLTLSGKHNGSLRGTMTITGPRAFTGSIRSEVDGVVRDVVPTQADCPGIHRAALDVTAVRAGEGFVRFAVTSHVPEDKKARPVTGARVVIPKGIVGPKSIAGRSDARGRVDLALPAGAGKRVKLRAVAGGFDRFDGSVRIPGSK